MSGRSLGKINNQKREEKAMKSNFSPVTIGNLRNHFKTTYKLNEEQIDLMVVSSARSLKTAFSAAEEILDSEDVCEKMIAVAHSLKGLLLNMGQMEWAGFAQEIEGAAKATENRDYHEMIRILRAGMEPISQILTGTVCSPGNDEIKRSLTPNEENTDDNPTIQKNSLG
jgi:hypothetical protein